MTKKSIVKKIITEKMMIKYLLWRMFFMSSVFNLLEFCCRLFMIINIINP